MMGMKVTKHNDGTVSYRMSLSDARKVIGAVQMEALNNESAAVKGPQFFCETWKPGEHAEVCNRIAAEMRELYKAMAAPLPDYMRHGL